jgi:hypothetical protein
MQAFCNSYLYPMKYLVLGVIMFTTFLAHAQTQQQAIDSATKLIQSRKYETAYKVLDNFDAENKIPEVADKKQDILLKYFVSSIMHTLFGLKDLKGKETISTYRGQPGSYSLFPFEAEEIFTRLKKEQPDNYISYKALGEYYYEVYLKYGDNWLIRQDSLFTLMESNCKIAAEHNAADYITYYILGFVSTSTERYDEGIANFYKCLELEPTHGPASYNMAYAYLYKDQRDSAIKYALRAYDTYTDASLKGDAARIAAVSYGELKDSINEIRYHELCDSVNPENYYSTKALIELYLKDNNSKAYPKRLKFFMLEPTEISTYNDLLDIYFKYNKQEELANFFRAQVKEAVADDFKVRGNLYFSLANIYFGKDDKKTKEYLLLSKEAFAKVYEKNNNIFKAIDKALKELK